MKAVNIIACGPGWEAAPPLSKDYDTWGMNTSVYMRECDVGFQVHTKEAWEKSCARYKHPVDVFEHSLKGAEEQNIPIYMLDIFPYSPKTAVRYPIEEIVEEFGEPYFSCSIPFMLALAIRQKYDKIDLYGCTVFVDSEYAWEKPCIEYWIGMARGRGIQVTLHEPTHVCKTHDLKIYGYDMRYPELKHYILQH